MHDYRLFRLDGLGQIMLVELIRAADDCDATRQAIQLAKSALKCEIWEGRRLVRTLGRGELAE